MTTGAPCAVSRRFTPEVLTGATTTFLVTLVVEVALIYGTLYFTATPVVTHGASVADIVCLCGYKYVGLVVSYVVGLLLGSFPFYIVLGYFAASQAFMVYSTLTAVARDYVPVHSEGSGRLAIFISTGLQVLAMVWLGWR
jgi:hypothetical protein